MDAATLCERYSDAFLGQPANAVTSGAFIVAGVGVLVTGRRIDGPLETPARYRQQVAFGLLVSGIGLGSFIQHGPHPDWQAYAHDLPLAGVLAFAAADAVADLMGRELSPAWWLVPTVAMVPVVASGATASTLVQAAMATAAIGLNMVRARVRPALRRRLHMVLLMVAAGALIGTLTDRTSLCQPDGVLQGHAVWHLLAATGLWVLAPAIGARLRVNATETAVRI